MKKSLLILSLLFLSTIGISQTYKCEIERFKDLQRMEVAKSVYHTINTSNAISYYDEGIKIELETIYEDEEFSAYLTLWTGNKRSFDTDYWDDRKSLPKEFSFSFTIEGMQVDCTCEIKP